MDKVLWLITDYVQIKGLTKSFAPLLSELLNAKNKDGKIIINAALKRDIGSRISATVGSIDNMIARLVEAELLIRIDRGMYTTNQELRDFSYEDNLIMKIAYSDKEKIIEISGGNR